MPINKRTLNELVSQVNMTDPQTIDRRTLARQISTALFMAQETAIPFDSFTVKVPTSSDGRSDMSLLDPAPTPRHRRHQLIQQYQRMQGALNDLVEPESSLTSKVVVTNIARAFQNSVKVLKEVSEHDQESVAFLPFTQSAVGRKNLARAIALAKQQVGMRPMEARPIIDAEITLAYQEDLQKYLDEQFPVTGNDVARPRLNERETLILAREFYEALDDHGDLEKAAQRINAFLVASARDMRFDLPLIEGVATPQYWEQRIVEGFENAPLRETFNELIGAPTLRDRLPVETVLRTLIDAGKGTEFNNIEPTIHYLDTDSQLDYERLMKLGNTEDNLVLVFQDERGRPAIATEHSAASDNLIRVFRPEHNPMIVSPPRGTGQELEEAAQNRLAILSNASDNLPPSFNPEETAEKLNKLETRWRNAVKAYLPDDTVTFGDQLASIQTGIREVAKEVLVPGFGGDANKANLQKLTKLCALTGYSELRSTKLTLGLPAFVGSRSSADRPDSEIVFTERPGEPEKCDIRIRRPEGETLKVIAAVQKSEANPKAIKAAVEFGQTTSLANRAFPVGMVSYEIDDLGTKALSAGHWLSEDARARCTEIHTSALPFLKWKGEPLFKDNSYRDADEASRLMASTVALLHGQTLDDQEATVAGDHAMSETLMLTIDLDDQFGSKRCSLPTTIYEQSTLEDIRRHLIQKISYSDLDENTKKVMCDRAAEASWEAAEYRMADAYEELERQEREMERMAPG